MALTLSVNVSKKAGLPDYGSVGACCGIEMELDAGLVDRDLDAFHGQVQRAYAACSRAVTDELARQTAPNPRDEQAVTKPSHNGNGSNGHRATDKQLDYAQQLSRQIQGLGVRKLETLASKMFDKPVAGLGTVEASNLIDMLKSIKGGTVKIEDALNGAPA